VKPTRKKPRAPEARHAPVTLPAPACAFQRFAPVLAAVAAACTWAVFIFCLFRFRDFLFKTKSLRYSAVVNLITSNIPNNPDSPAPAVIPSSSKRLRYFELALVLLIALTTPFLGSLYVFIHGPQQFATASPFRFLSGIIHEILALLLLAYVLARRGQRFRDLGLKWSLKDLGSGLLLFLASFVSMIAAVFVLQFAHRLLYGSLLPMHSGREFWSHPGIRSLPYLLLTPFFEEIMVRAYLMTELIDLTGSALLAVVVSAGVQVSYHLYYGGPVVLALFVNFFILSLYFARFRRPLPTLVAHYLQDVLAFSRIW
jgi:membrane protease YdiL (CAAX protease family)